MVKNAGCAAVVALAYAYTMAAFATTSGSIFDPNDFVALGPITATSGQEIIFDSDNLRYTYQGVDHNGTLAYSESHQTEIAVFCFTTVSFEEGSTATIIGKRAIAILSRTNINVASVIDVSGARSYGSGSAGINLHAGGDGGTNGQGGGLGGGGYNAWQPGPLPDFYYTIGAGGSFGGIGGTGTGNWGGTDHYALPQAAYGTADLSELLAGSGGGGSITDTGGILSVGGGGGGGCLALSALDTIVVDGGINADGGAGSHWIGNRTSAGGSGGGILVAARAVSGSGYIRANGGSGGQGHPGYATSGAGSGGRIAIYRDSLTLADLSVTPGFYGNSGNPGTIYNSDTVPFLRGSLKATITPEAAVVDGARWRRVGTTSWLTSGDTESGNLVGEHAIEFKDISGWTRPANQNVTINVGQTVSITGTYKPGILITGTVVDSGDIPIEGAWVAASAITTSSSITNAQGRFEVTVEAEFGSTVTLTAGRVGFAPYQAQMTAPVDSPVTIQLQAIDDWQENYRVIYRKDGKPATVSSVSRAGITITNGGKKDTLTIKRTPYAQGERVIPLITSDGSFAAIYTDAPVARLEVTGQLRSLTAKGCHVEWVEAGEIGTVRMSPRPVSEDGSTGLAASSPAYAFVTLISNSAVPFDANGRFIAPTIQATGAIFEGVSLKAQQRSAQVSAASKKLAGGTGDYVSYGGLSAAHIGESHLWDKVGGDPALRASVSGGVEAWKIGGLNVTGGAIEPTTMSAKAINSVSAKMGRFKLKTPNGTRWAIFDGDIRARELVSGDLSRSLSVTAVGGDIEIGDPLHLTGGVAAGGIMTGGGISKIQARAVLARTESAVTLCGGRVGFIPDALVALGSGKSVNDGPLMNVASGVKALRNSLAKNMDIVTITGDTGVFGKFVAEDAEAGSAVTPMASIKSLKTFMKDPGTWPQPSENWWFKAAGFGYSFAPINVKSGDHSQFHDMLHP